MITRQAANRSRPDGGGRGAAMAPPLRVPAECAWALDSLYRLQRSGAPRRPQALARYVSAAYADELGRFLAPVRARARNCSGPRLRVVDIGAGLAMYHAALDRDLGGCVEHFLVDKSANEVPAERPEQHGGWHPHRLPFYNSMECARRIARASGIDGARWHGLNASAAAIVRLGPRSVDVAMSLLSCGFHYPVSAYAAAVAKVLKPEGFFVVTLRRGMRQEEALREAGFRCVDGGKWAQSAKGALLACRVRGASS